MGMVRVLFEAHVFTIESEGRDQLTGSAI